MQYEYRARDWNGNLVTGRIEALDEADAKRSIGKQNLVIIDVKSHSNFLDHLPLTRVRQFLKPRVSDEDLMLFFQQLQTVYSVGVPLLRGLELIGDQLENPTLKSQVAEIRNDISKGLNLSQAMEKIPSSFSKITVNLVHSGETSGQLEEILDRIAKSFEQQIDQKAKIKAATFYPKIVGFMIVFVVGFVVYFIVPKFKSVFSRFGSELPMITQIMVGISDFAVSYWYFLIGLGLSAYVGFKKYVGSISGRRTWDEFTLKVPILGRLLLQNDIYIFCSTFALLIRSGIPALQGLGIVKSSLDNTLLREDIERVEQGLRDGESIRDGLAKSILFPKTATNLIGVGEEAGELETTLNKLSTYYKRQIDYTLANLSKSIEPILLFVVFGMVLALALAVFLPMWKMNSIMKR